VPQKPAKSIGFSHWGTVLAAFENHPSGAKAHFVPRNHCGTDKSVPFFKTSPFRLSSEIVAFPGSIPALPLTPPDRDLLP
jgi:hypothetical protein